MFANSIRQIAALAGHAQYTLISADYARENFPCVPLLEYSGLNAEQGGEQRVAFNSALTINMNLINAITSWFQCHQRGERRRKYSDAHSLLHHPQPLVKILHHIPPPHALWIRFPPLPRDIKPRDVFARVEDLDDHGLISF